VEPGLEAAALFLQRDPSAIAPSVRLHEREARTIGGP